MSEIKYEIIKQIGVLSKSASGWAKTPSVPRGGTPPPMGWYPAGMLREGRVGVGMSGNQSMTSGIGPRIGGRWARA